MEFIKIKEESDKVCCYCGKEITDKEDLTLDHIVPLSKGGEDAKDNLVVSCKACNSEKADLDVTKYTHFVNIMNSLEQNNDTEFITEMFDNFKEKIKNFNDKITKIKRRKSYLERKRTAILESMMYEKFNVVRGYYYAKKLQEITEEIYNLNLTVSQMTIASSKLNPLFSFLNGTSADTESIKKSVLKTLRGTILQNYYNLREEEPKEQCTLSGTE